MFLELRRRELVQFVIDDVNLAIAITPIAPSLRERADRNREHAKRLMLVRDRDESDLAFVMAEEACFALLKRNAGARRGPSQRYTDFPSNAGQVALYREPVGSAPMETTLRCAGVAGLSVAHASGLAVAAAATTPVGVDVEEVETYTAMEPLIRRRHQGVTPVLDDWLSREAEHKMHLAAGSQIEVDVGAVIHRWGFWLHHKRRIWRVVVTRNGGSGNDC